MINIVTALYHFLSLVVPIEKKAALPGFLLTILILDAQMIDWRETLDYSMAAKFDKSLA